MRIAVVSIGSFDTQYSDYHLMKDVIIGLLERKHAVLLIQKQYLKEPRYPEEFNPFLLSGQLKVFNIPFEQKERTNLKARYIADMKYYIKACKRLKTLNSEAIYLQSNNTAFVTVFYVKHFIKKPVLYNEQDLFPDNARLAGILNTSSLVYKLAHVLQKYSYQNINALSTISDDIRDTITTQYAIAKDRIQVIYNWGHEQCTQGTSNFFLDKYPKKEHEFRAVYAGNLGKMQNVEIILKAAKQMKKCCNVMFYIVGSGANEIALKEYAKENKLSNVVFVGMQPQDTVGDLYKSADVNLIPLQPGLVFAALPSKTADCLLADKPIIFCIDENSKFAELAARYGMENATSNEPEKLKQMILNVQNESWSGHPRQMWNDYFSKNKNVAKFCESIETLHDSRQIR